jgi:cytochrome c553
MILLIILGFACQPVSHPATSQQVPVQVPEAAISSPGDGRTVFTSNCISCHRKAFEMETVMRANNASQLKGILNSLQHPTKFPDIDTSATNNIKAYILEDGEI